MAQDTVSYQITTAVTAQILETLDGIGEPTALSVTAVFNYVASAATSAKAYVQTSFDGGTTWFDVMCFAFTTASGQKYLSSTAMKEVNATVSLTQAALSDNTSINGLLGDQIRFLLTTVGTYGAGTSIALTPAFKY